MSWLPPSLAVPGGAGVGGADASGAGARPLELLHGDIIEYLRGIPRDLKATFVDIERELGIDLNHEQYVLDMLKSNPKVEVERTGENSNDLTFRYRTKFNIANKAELVKEIGRVQNGIAAMDICTPPCYAGVELDIQNLIVGGDIIACKNKTLKTAVLFPRGRAFFSALSGTVTAAPGQQAVKTSESLLSEVRRGDAIGISGNWFRVASNVGSVGSHQAERASAPLSVTSDVELSDKNVYRDRFDHSVLPLDGDYDGEAAFTGPALRHGVTNDVRALWRDTAAKAKEFRDGPSLRHELVRCKLLSTIGLQTNGAAKTREKKPKERKKRKARDTGRVFNSHLQGSALDLAMKALAEQGGTD